MNRSTERRCNPAEAGCHVPHSTALAGARCARSRCWQDERGFTLMEMLIASFISILTLSAAVTVASGVNRGYSAQLDSAAVEEEARFTLDWIERTLRSAGSNPYSIALSNCPGAATPFLAIRMDPNANGQDDDIRINADVNPPNGLLGGDLGACVESREDITIALDAVASTVAQQDMNIDAAPVAMTDNVIVGLQFTYLDVNRAATINPNAVSFIGVAVTAQSTRLNPNSLAFDTFTLNSEVRVRVR